jgi:hypothetical protein
LVRGKAFHRMPSDIVRPQPDGNAISNSIKPVTQEVAFPKAACLTNEDEKRGLEGILGIVDIAEQAPAQGQHHRSVPGEKDFKRRFVAALGKSFQELVIGARALSGRAHDPPKLPHYLG